jgi:preprotein translocase subunit SecD
MRYPLWKTALILGVCLLSVVLTLPNFVSQATLERLPDPFPKGRIVLGLDLQGGSSLLLEVQTDAIVKERLENLANDIRGALRPARINYRGLGVQGETVVFTLVDPAAQLAAAREKLDEVNPRLTSTVGFGAGTAREFEVAVDEQTGRFQLSFDEQARANLTRAAVEQSIEVVRRRIDQLGTREASIQRQGTDRILVQVPGERNPENIKRLLGRTARLTFHLVDQDNSVQEAVQGRVPAGSFLAQADDAEGGGPYLLKSRVELSGENLTDAQPSFQDNEPVVSFRLDGAGARTFGRLTQDNVGKLFAILLDDRVISAPRIREPILGGSGVISGSFTVESANELAVLLRSGALPAPLNIIEERSVGAELGADSIRAGTIACIVAGLLVVALMAVYYGVFGLIANVALVVNVVLILACMSVLQSTLTLPGIAGIILTIGTAVDSNVLIYERIREEARNGRTPLSAISSGFDEALRTIVDSNLTTLIAALALFQFGTGPVKGFAVTLGFGILANMFTAVTFTRLLVAMWYRRARPAALPL